MRHFLTFTAAGLGMALIFSALAASEVRITASGAVVAKKPAPIVTPPAKDGATCGEYGTTVHFEKDPKAASATAKKEGKLVMVLHVSGNFETPDFTWNNAEALRVNALANPKVGEFVNEYFACAFQKVGTFKVVGKQKQGGNVATYFCAPDGRVLHCVAGPVNADTLLKEAKWVVESAEKAIKESKGDGGKFKAMFRKWHADRLRNEHGLVVEAVTFDPPDAQDDGPLQYRDPSGRPLAPKLPDPPIDGPDVRFKEQLERAAKAAPTGSAFLADRAGRRWVLPNQGRVHMLMAAHSMLTIDKVYGAIFEGILGEKVSTKPVEIVHPFPWHKRGGINNLNKN